MHRPAALLVVVSGCVTQTVHVRPRALAEHEAALVTQSSASIPVDEGGTAEIAASREVLVWIPNITVLERQRCLKLPKIPFRPCFGENREIADAEQARHVTVRELVTGCTAGDCLAKRAKDEPVEVGTRTEVSGTAVARTIGAVGAAGLATYCFAECEDAAKTLGVAAVVVGALLLIEPLRLLAR
jgi:hypothetical protein